MLRGYLPLAVLQAENTPLHPVTGSGVIPQNVPS